VTESGVSILVIEDDAVALQLFQEILAALGYDVRVAADAESGLREIARAVPAAVLLDLRLPLADGLELLRDLRTGTCTDLPVAIMTGDYFVDDRVVRDIEALGARVHFKPLFEDDLRKVVSGLLRHTHDPDQDQHGPM
jgi:DNA-binding response OmpR family regulator